MYKPQEEIMMIQRHVSKQELHTQHKKNFCITYHHLINVEDQWKLLATFEDEVQLTLRGKTVQVWAFDFAFGHNSQIGLDQLTFDDKEGWRKKAPEFQPKNQRNHKWTAFSSTKCSSLLQYNFRIKCVSSKDLFFLCLIMHAWRNVYRKQ